MKGQRPLQRPRGLHKIQTQTRTNGENGRSDASGSPLKLPILHPGEFLREILEDRGLSQAEFSRKIGVPAMRVCRVLSGNRPVTAELALLFGKAFGQSPQYWLNLQASSLCKLHRG